ncbi:hypothetical protein FRUB_04676 [Fimbriiglobus ruber]|uniref:Uncharacterized protein n=1 Tax=Fimbriiglobus ruber TaxID=1908690 RepID=A0A225DMD5_9BACT|nr:hypothetical protein FRUB_04676 [Fimbriiglobus ruber]
MSIAESNQAVARRTGRNLTRDEIAVRHGPRRFGPAAENGRRNHTAGLAEIPSAIYS